MTTYYRTGRAAVLASLLGSTAVHADVTAEDVWTAFQDNFSMVEEATLEVGGEESADGVLTASDVTLTIEDEESTVTMELGTMVFTELGDGTVSIEMEETMPLTVVVDPTFGTPTTVSMTVSQEGTELIVGGTPEAMSYDLTSARYVIALDSVEGDGDDVVVNAGEISLSDITGSYGITQADGLDDIDYALTVGDVSVAIDVSESGGPGVFQFLGNIAGLETVMVASIPSEMDMDAPETAFVDGLAIDGGYTFGASNYAFTFTDGDTVQGTASADGGQMNIAMSSDGFSYSGGATNPKVSFEGGEVPFPVEISMSEYAYGLSMPLSASDTPEEFGLNIRLADLTVNDMIWSMIDPGGILDHGPATVNLDLTGEATLAYDVLDPAQMQEMMMADMPGELNAISLNDLTVSVAGASLNGSGAFVFDNDTPSMFAPLGQPTGSVTLELNGGNQLIDKLVEMGLIPEDQVMGARMMMGMFAQVVGDDMLRTELEVNDQGHVIVNGQRIQ